MADDWAAFMKNKQVSPISNTDDTLNITYELRKEEIPKPDGDFPIETFEAVRSRNPNDDSLPTDDVIVYIRRNRQPKDAFRDENVLKTWVHYVCWQVDLPSNTDNSLCF